MKVCRFGGEELVGEGHITYYRRLDDTTEEEFACRQHDLEHRARNYEESGVITTSLLMQAMLIHSDKVRGKEPSDWAPWVDRMMREIEPVWRVGKEWERAVWFGGHEPDKDDAVTEPAPYDGRQYREVRGRLKLPKGSLQAFVIPAEFKGYSAMVDGLKYISYTIAGRSVFQVEDGAGAVVSMIMDETSCHPRGGLQAIGARSEQAVEMFQRAIADWQSGRITLSANDGVGIG